MRDSVNEGIRNGEYTGNVGSITRVMWKDMTDAQKAPYVDQYNCDQAAYNAKLKELNIPAHAKLILRSPPNGEDVQFIYEDVVEASDEASMHLEIPVSRVKQLAATIPSIPSLGTEAASAVARATELFIAHFARHASASARSRNHKSIHADDVSRAVRAVPELQFLRVPLHAHGAGTGAGAPGPVSEDFDLSLAETSERDAAAESGVQPGVHMVHTGADGALVSHPYLLAGGAVNSEGGVVDLEAVAAAEAAAGAVVAAPKPRKGSRAMTDEQKAAAAAKRKATMERKKAEAAAAKAAAAGEASVPAPAAAVGVDLASTVHHE